MTPEQAVDFLFQLTTQTAMPLASHVQAQQAYQLVKKFISDKASTPPVELKSTK